MSTRVFALVFALIGGLAIVLSINARPTVPAGWAVTQGTVVDYVEGDGGDTTTRAAVVEYRAGDGTAYRIVNRTSFGLGLGEKLGDAMDVAYDPARPDQARLTSGSAAWGWLMGVGIGALFALVGLLMLGHELRARFAVQAASPAAANATAGGTVAISHVGGTGYAFRRESSRVWLDVVIAPGMALMFGGVGWLLMNTGGDSALFGVALVAAALLLIGFVVYDLRQGLFSPAAEVGAGGIWLRGVGRFSWDELTEVRHERFAAPAGEQGLATYDRLGLVPGDEESYHPAGVSDVIKGIANQYNEAFMPMAERRPIELAPIGLMGYEVADFDGLVRQVRRYFPVTEVSDEPEPDAASLDAGEAPEPYGTIPVDASET